MPKFEVSHTIEICCIVEVEADNAKMAEDIVKDAFAECEAYTNYLFSCEITDSNVRSRRGCLEGGVDSRNPELKAILGKV